MYALRTIGSACADVERTVDEILAVLPFPGPPEPAEVTALLHGADLRLEPVDLPEGQRVTIAYLETLVDADRLWREVLQPLLSGTAPPDRLPRTRQLQSGSIVLHRLLAGWAVIFRGDGLPLGLMISGVKRRPVREPTTERSLIGPKEGLVEDLALNIGLVRTRLRDPLLRVEQFTVGRRSRTGIALLYVEDVAAPAIVRLIRRRLKRVAVDTIRTTADVVEITIARGLTVFPLVEETERPDKVETALAVGRICVLLDGSPFAILLPVTFFEFQKDSESAVQGPLVAGFIVQIRFLGILTATILPSLYVALLTVNVTVLPLPMAITLSTTRVAIPYPVLTETLIMMVIADVLTEATSQAASAVGNTLAIVGTLIIGQMVVQARLASNLMVIVLAGSVMGSFLTLKYQLSYAFRIIKYPLIVLSGLLGLEGLIGGLILLLVHLVSLKSAGVPYLSPLAPADWRSLRQYSVVQPPRGDMRRRPGTWRARQRVRGRRRGRR